MGRLSVTVYADVLFLINFTMDFLALYIVSFLLKLRFVKSRAVFSALLGALYGVLAVVRHKDNFFIALAAAVLICFIAFGADKISDAVIKTVSFVSVSFLLGGGMTAVFNVFNSVGYQRKVSVYGQVETIEKPLPFPVFLLGFVLIAAVSMAFCRIFLRKGKIRTVKAEITLGENKVSLFLCEDSGNLLCEPSSGDPVIFLSQKAFEKLLGKENSDGIVSLETKTLEKYKDKLRLAVYETVGGRGVARCIRPDEIVIEGKRVRAFVTTSEKNGFGIYDGIIPSALLAASGKERRIIKPNGKLF